MKKIFCFSFILLFSLCAFSEDFLQEEVSEKNESIGNKTEAEQELLEENDEILIEEPELSTQISFGTRIQIRTSKTSELVFINGNFQGKTPLTIKNLLSGYYKLQIKTKNETKDFWIEVKDKRFDKYFFE